MIARSGWTDVAWKNMTFGVVALHHAIRAAGRAPGPSPTITHG